jgi:hypothetical protein
MKVTGLLHERLISLKEFGYLQSPAAWPPGEAPGGEGEQGPESLCWVFLGKGRQARETI